MTDSSQYAEVLESKWRDAYVERFGFQPISAQEAWTAVVDDRIFGDTWASVGATPLVEVPSPECGARILAKLEWHNPTGTVKDRVACGLVAHYLKTLGLGRFDRHGRHARRDDAHATPAFR